jgi:hypothetical protein
VGDRGDHRRPGLLDLPAGRIHRRRRRVHFLKDPLDLGAHVLHGKQHHRDFPFVRMAAIAHRLITGREP